MKKLFKRIWDNMCWYFEDWGFIIILPIVGVIVLFITITYHVHWSMR